MVDVGFTHHIDDRLDLELENRKDAREIMDVYWIVGLNDHVAAVVADPHHELMHCKTRGHFPVFVEYLQDPFLRGFVVAKGGCRTLAPADDVFHDRPLHGASVGLQAVRPDCPEYSHNNAHIATDECLDRDGAANRSPSGRPR